MCKSKCYNVYGKYFNPLLVIFSLSHKSKRFNVYGKYFNPLLVIF